MRITAKPVTDEQGGMREMRVELEPCYNETKIHYESSTGFYSHVVGKMRTIKFTWPVELNKWLK